MKPFLVQIISALLLLTFVIYFLSISAGIFGLASQLPLRAYLYLALHPQEVLGLYEKEGEVKNKSLEGEHLLASLIEENTTLRSALEYKKNTKQKLVVAEVIGYATDPFLRILIIDHGKEDGIREGMPVTNEHGLLLGKVDQVFTDRSFVKQIQSPDVEFLVHLEGNDTRSDFVARGMINYVMGTKMQKGNYGDRVPVVTSGLDGKFPRGLLVGEARMFTLSKDQTFIESIIQTDNEPKKQVFVITESTH